MNKKIFYAFSLSFLCSISHASVFYKGDNIAWSGLYFGSYFGSGAGDADTSYSDGLSVYTLAEDVGGNTITQFTEQGAASLNGNVTGSLADLFVGYNFQLSSYPKLIFGGQLEGTFFNDISLETSGQRNFSSIETSDDGTALQTDNITGSASYDLKDELTSMVTLNFRGGYLVNQNTLLYILGGASGGNFVIPENSDLIGKDWNKWELGYTVGAGLEYKINEHLSVRGEYRFISFEINRDRTFSSTANTDPDGPNNLSTTQTNATQRTSTDFSFNIGKIGIVYQI